MGIERRRGRRGRVVMIVDNAVDGDSRVQKVARSAAEAGWDVTLLGRSPTAQTLTWRIAGARVCLLPVGGEAGGKEGGGRAGRWRAAIRRGLVRLPRPLLRALRQPVDLTLVWFWRAALGDRAWRRLEPALWEYESAYAPVIDELAPDLIHAHDFRMIGVGARAVRRGRDCGRTVKLVWDAHEFLPGIKPRRDHARWLPAHEAYVREYVPYADAIVTVSAELAELLRREHGLTEPPAVVLNAPDVATGENRGGDAAGGLRERCGIGPDVPLLVYSGAAAPQRGLSDMVRALPALPEAHVALMINQPDGGYAAELQRLADALGVADRLHLLSYVPHHQVVRVLSEADAGVIPIGHYLNHEIALITKFFEYSHARLPIVVSDVRTMAEEVRRTGQGEVFPAGDVTGYVRAVRAVLDDPSRYRCAYDAPGLLAGWTWQRQADVLDRIYTDLVPGRELVGESAGT
jgi:glycosyltransferase involved in cell wall biosynthesis